MSLIFGRSRMEDKKEMDQTETGRFPEMEITQIHEEQTEQVTGGTDNPETELPEIFD